MSGLPYTPSRLGVRPSPALVQQLLVGAFGWMFAGLLLSAGVAFLVSTSPALTRTVSSLWLVVMLGQLGLAVVIQSAIARLSPTVSLALFFVFAATMGLALGVIVPGVARQPGGAGAVASAFLSASAMFGAAALYGAVTRRELAGLGGILFMGLIGLLVAMLVNLFLASGPLGWLISIIGVVLFTVLTAYDVQRIARGDYAALTGSPERGSVLGALRLYLDFVNLFLFLLRLFSSSRS